MPLVQAVAPGWPRGVNAPPEQSRGRWKPSFSCTRISLVIRESWEEVVRNNKQPHFKRWAFQSDPGDCRQPQTASSNCWPSAPGQEAPGPRGELSGSHFRWLEAWSREWGEHSEAIWEVTGRGPLLSFWNSKHYLFCIDFYREQ